MTLWYLPIEPYEERYTKQLDDWVTMALDEKDIDYFKLSGTTDMVDKVQRGQVLDAVGRPVWCMEQAKQLLDGISRGIVEKGDKIFTMDIWQFGMEAVAYASEQMGLDLEFYGFNCAGSFEWYDFINLTGIGRWGKHLERAWFNFYTKVFFASEKLRNMAFRDQMFDDKRKAVITGLAANSKYVLNQIGLKNNKEAFISPQKTDTVVFPHRYDFEKNPSVFLDVAERLYERADFIITTGRNPFSGTADIERAIKLQKKGILKIKAGMSKKEYYQTLLKSSIVFSSAKQDTIGNCILESVALGCTPVVNTGVSYEEFLPKKFIYTDGCVDEACELILKYLEKPENAYPYTKRYDNSINNMIKEMGY